jgi:hypothetical protein
MGSDSVGVAEVGLYDETLRRWVRQSERDQDEICRRRLCADRKRPLSQRVEERLARFDHGSVARGNDEELRGHRHVRTAEHRRGCPCIFAHDVEAGEDRLIAELVGERPSLLFECVRDYDVRALGDEAARVAAPIPRAPPVTITVRLSKGFVILSF